MSDVIAQQTTTLPEGAQVSVFKTRTVRNYRRGPITTTSLVLQASFNNKIIKMRVEDDISAAMLYLYLELVVREIKKQRGLLGAKPGSDILYPKTIEHFVLSMAYNGMFMLDDLTGATETL